MNNYFLFLFEFNTVKNLLIINKNYNKNSSGKLIKMKKNIKNKIRVLIAKNFCYEEIRNFFKKDYRKIIELRQFYSNKFKKCLNLKKIFIRSNYYYFYILSEIFYKLPLKYYQNINENKISREHLIEILFNQEIINKFDEEYIDLIPEEIKKVSQLMIYYHLKYS